MTTDQAPAVERRRHPRHDVTVPARLTLVGLTVDGMLENVSAGGVRFTTSDEKLAVAAGNFIAIEFDCMADGAPKPINRNVRVTRVDERTQDGATIRSLGLEFDELLELVGLSF